MALPEELTIVDAWRLGEARTRSDPVPVEAKFLTPNAGPSQSNALLQSWGF